MAPATLADLRFRTRLSTAAVTGSALVMSSQRDFFASSSGRFFQRKRYIAAHVRAASSSRTRRTTSKEILEDRTAEHVAKGFEDIAGVIELSSPTLDAGVAILIVPRPFFFVA
jgi:hypothetical protein